MILDTSAVVAIVFKEKGFEDLLEKLTASRTVAMGTPTLTETGIVLTARLGSEAQTLLARFIQEFQIVTVPFGEDHWSVAIDAYRRFGKGRHAANLNFGDCLAYAVSKLSDQPLLCVGQDFQRTDLELA